MPTSPSRSILGLAALVAACGAPERADPPPPSIDPSIYAVEVLADGLDTPWSLAFLPDGGLLVTERSGRLLHFASARSAPQPIDGAPEVYVAGQGGLLDVVIDPDFDANRLVYLSYAHGDARANTTRVARARFDADAARLDGLDVIFDAELEKDTDVHYGGRMAFGPEGGLLVTLGDGFGYREEAQRLQTNLGVIARILPEGGVPQDNPFLETDGARPEIWSYGHRNVQGVVLDPSSGVVWSHEHGPRGGDEINRIERGGNYGWPIATTGIDYAGAVITPFESYEGMIDPVHDWTPSIAPAGLALYDGDAFPQWRGDLFVAALASRDLRRLDMEEGRVVGEQSLLGELDERMRDVRVGPDGALYVLTDSVDGRLLRVTPAG